MVGLHSLIYRIYKPPGLNWTEVYLSNSYIPRWWHLLRVLIKHLLCPTLNHSGIKGQPPYLILIPVDKIIYHWDNSMSNSRYEMPLCSLTYSEEKHFELCQLSRRNHDKLILTRWQPFSSTLSEYMCCKPIWNAFRRFGF